MKNQEEIRIRNPFHDPLVTELIEDPNRYHEMFSERILVGETLEIFQPANVILVGPQGSGKSMILNLLRYKVFSEWISKHGKPPAPLKHLAPFLGISINLVRANFHAFGRRSVSRVIHDGKADQELDAMCAADFLNHYLFREFLQGLQFLAMDEKNRLREWLKIGKDSLKINDLVSKMASWDCWFGYYSDCNSLDSLLARCDKRLSAWRSFLNANSDSIPREVWASKATLGEPLHAMGNLLKEIHTGKGQLPLFVVIDQYEVLPELNKSYGTTLQRIINALIKARDPVVFYKIGARTYDWGNELRVWGAESRIEVQRDYVMINLADVLMRKEYEQKWLFPEFAKDVAYKRIKKEGNYQFSRDKVEEIFGRWTPINESKHYFKNKSKWPTVVRKLPDAITSKITNDYVMKSPLELRLASAWALERIQRNVPESKIIREIDARPWLKPWWRKERHSIALHQIASISNEKKYYYGWKNVLFLSGANISAFLLICSEIWDMATKTDIHPLKENPIPYKVQTGGIYIAAGKWSIRDRNEDIGGRHRYQVLSRLGPAIHDALIEDLAISNPGHTGFSLRESDLTDEEMSKKVSKFLQNAVNWAILEERPHTSKIREGTTRRKWYLHPLLSPFFGIPHVRAKEPFYVGVEEVYNWIFGKDRIRFSTASNLTAKVENRSSNQLRLPLEDS